MKKRTEATEQAAVFDWAEVQAGKCPALRLLHHVPNGGSRNPIEAVHLKQQGVRSGVPDIHLPVPRSGYASLWIEMKYGKNRVTANQRKWIDALRNAGNAVAVCYSADEAIKIIETYLTGDLP